MEKEQIKEEKTEKSVNKTNKLLVVIIVLLVLVILGMLAATFVPSLIGKSESTNETKQEATVTEIKNIDVLKELSVKIDRLLGIRETEYNQNIDYFGTFYAHEILKVGLTDKTKQRAVLSQIDWSPMNQEVWQTAKNHEFISRLIPSYTESYTYGSTKYVTLEKVNAYSTTLFGENLKTILKEINECPTYLYDESNKIFYYPEPQCGGTSSELIRGFKSKFEELNDEVYVYVSFAFLIPDPANQGTAMEMEEYIVYKDYDYIPGDVMGTHQHKNVYQTGLSSYQARDFKLNKDNYKDFSEYKFTFKKDKNNNYYFVKLEQTK